MADAADLCIAHAWNGCERPRHTEAGYCEPPNARCRAAVRRAHKRGAVRADGSRVVEGHGAEQAAQEVLREELRPAIRDALTKEVLEGIHALVGALPLAIATAIVNLESEDETVRQRAAELIMRHSAGNKQIVPDVNAGKTGDLNVIFNLPRPEARAAGLPEGEVIDEKECDSCHVTKPLKEFVGQSDRCFECFERMQNSVKDLAASGDPQA